MMGSVVAGADAPEQTRVEWDVHDDCHDPTTMPRRDRRLGQSPYRSFNDWVSVHGYARPMIVSVKMAHTLIFAVLSACVLHITVAGVRGRFTPRVRASMLAVVVEAAIFIVNGKRCPLTDMVEDLGDEHGTVGDIFLPDWLATRIYPISTSLLSLGLGSLLLRRVWPPTRPHRRF